MYDLHDIFVKVISPTNVLQFKETIYSALWYVIII